MTRYLEHNEQCKVFEWAFYHRNKYPPLRYIFSSQAGEKFKTALQAHRAKMAGMRKGVPDIFLPSPNKQYAGLFIELKRPIIKGQSKPIVSAEQQNFIDYLNDVGYKAIVCYGAGEAIMQMENYLQNG